MGGVRTVQGCSGKSCVAEVVVGGTEPRSYFLEVWQADSQTIGAVDQYDTSGNSDSSQNIQFILYLVTCPIAEIHPVSGQSQ